MSSSPKIDIILWCQQNKLNYNEFNKLIDYTVAEQPDWIETLSQPGFIELIRTYLHD